MAGRTSGSGIVTLWCFTSSLAEERQRELNGRFRWGRITRVTPEDTPVWKRLFAGDCYRVGDSYGSYNGCLGNPDQQDRQDASRPAGEATRRIYKLSGSP